MTSVPMRKLPAPSVARTTLSRTLQSQSWRPSHIPPSPRSNPPSRALAQVRPEPLHELWFTSSAPRQSPSSSVLSENHGPDSTNSDHPPPSERTLALGRTLRTLSPLLPNILTVPLPPSIISPSVTLHLFPSTHPHLPVVKGRVAYRAALFTAPVAWGTVPLVGNVKLRIVSEKMVRTGYGADATRDLDGDAGEEKLVVRWVTEAKTNGHTSTPAASASTSAHDTNASLSTLLGGSQRLSTNNDNQFSGLFIFTFDAKGRVASHTIEHADEDSGYDRTSRVVTVADWLLGKARGKRAEEADLVPGLGVAAGGGGLAQLVRLAREERAKDRWVGGKLW
ncbi:uncharacterized protein HMPREF1541_11004 [Cyphellophora europaea CBS 101466]|uniref:Chromosome transmission fidelity protein 4 n=1 Tax=Cyphellophora europaea (strain CBS 101466) TaxID=1220924 RepID=W2S775_CYPE1|nr:uncharacterized protein HMPREF1541_11004 [Cyphellophora europaea CBS 101466]ETN43873.1 hypothetical protein HMPREF1541_11004 [Cyphellophora europaea CBS 101466]